MLMSAVHMLTKLKHSILLRMMYCHKIVTALYCFTADQNNKRIVLALQSGLKSELTWALNTLTLLSFKEKDEVRKDATPLAKIPGLLDALLQVVSQHFAQNLDIHLYSSRPLSVRGYFYLSLE